MFQKAVLLILKFYKRGVSPFLVGFFGNACRFSPTCSEYCYHAVKKYGAKRGLLMGVWRFARCNPFSKAGLDPVI